MSKKLEEIELRSEQVQDILSYVPHWMIRYGNLVFLLLIVLFLALSFFIKYPDVISAQALVTTKIPPQKEYAKITSRIQAILVKDNAIVTPNTPLAILENTANYKDVFLLKSILDTIRPNTQAFYFPINDIPLLFLGNIDNDFAIFENNYIQYVLNKELQPFSNEALANKTTLSELHTRLANSKSQLEINRAELAYKKNKLERNKTLYKKGIIAKLEYENNEIEYAQAQRNFKSFEASISQIRESISNANTTRKGNKINNTREEIKLLKNVLQSFNQLKIAIKDWENTHVLSSKLNGKVSFMNFKTVNETVTAGDLVFTIIPNKNLDYIAKLKTPILNSGKLKTGRKVNISIENYPETEFGFLTGTINKISAIPR
ncbi:HlyD family efflux transporter periplasmic adaptor subunit [Lacinutrix neustonica]|uniref:HlyD family efflux transporter periplasmic adaptor subunit n=1 Tax=Lacinutrix neustonica TaxID=2980107 RepID=A0A9E8SEK0_9FLAO|nr:HlyD family efflux transporter periplasmic adaptor subunit [Lacinutrix neustonica]WAC03633.1 HlyD family efflux transporter periplasmic adaptor subunit [Lacinutrix neustonica]